VRAAGGAGALGVLLVLLWGLRQASARPLAAGERPGLTRRPPALLAATLAFAGLGWGLWRPLPLRLGPAARTLALAAGAPLYAAGLALVMWGRLALGDMFAASSSRGAPLFAEQRLVTHGPYARVRHPMYLGYMLAAVGGLLLYRTWTTLLLVPASLTLALRARREEAALAARFGAAWAAYVRRVPAWIPGRHSARQKG
jgi:protein-S-isoprenylcysteine O-methyltransferase Ste14